MRKNHLKDYIEFVPFTLNIPKVLDSIDILVRPSLSGDPWGRDIIEAMAHKKAIVATGQSEYLIKNGYNGYLVKPNDPQNLGERIYELVENPELRELFGVRSYEIVKEKCDLKRYGKNLWQIYNS